MLHAQTSVAHVKPSLIGLPKVLAKQSVIIVPGLDNSDEHHWQSLWQSELPDSSRIHVDNWHIANLDSWNCGIIRALQNTTQPAVLIAHSFGVLAAATIAEQFPELIEALFLVAPADPAKFNLTNRLPERPLRVPALLVASSDDPWLADHKAAYWALRWGADYHRFKNVGHVTCQSGLGLWQEGVGLRKELLKNLTEVY